MRWVYRESLEGISSDGEMVKLRGVWYVKKAGHEDARMKSLMVYMTKTQNHVRSWRRARKWYWLGDEGSQYGGGKETEGKSLVLEELRTLM